MKQCDIFVNDFEKSADLKPVFKKIIHKPGEKTSPASMIKRIYLASPAMVKVNKSICTLDIIIENTGTEDISSFDLILNFPEGIQEISNTTRFKEGYNCQSFISSMRYIVDKISIGKEDNIFFSLSFRVPPKSLKYNIEWQFTTEDYENNGFIPLSIDPQFIIENKDLSSSGENQIIEDFIDEIKEAQIQKEGCLFKDL